MESNPPESGPAVGGLDVSGIVVHVHAAAAPLARSALESISGVTVHAVDAHGKVVATIESDSASRSMELFERVRQLPQVLSMAMVYHQFESEPDQEI